MLWRLWLPTAELTRELCLQLFVLFHPQFEGFHILSENPVLMSSFPGILVGDVIVIHQVFHLPGGDVQVLAQFTACHVVFHSDLHKMRHPCTECLSCYRSAEYR